MSAYFTLAFLFILIGRHFGDTGTDGKNNSVFEALVDQAMKNIRVHTNWLTSNVTEIKAQLDSFFNEETTTGQTESSTEDETLTSIEKLLQKMGEQINALYKQTEKEGGITEVANQVWKYLKDTFAYMFNILTDRNSARKALQNMSNALISGQNYLKRMFTKPINYLRSVYDSITGRNEELQADSLNSTLDTIIATGKRLYEGISGDSKDSFKALSEKMAALWQQVYTEVSNMKNILSDENQTIKSLESFVKNFREHGPASLKNALEQMKKDEHGGDIIEQIGGIVGQMMTKLTPSGGPAALWSQSACQSDPIECEYWQCVMDNIKNSPQIANLKLGSKIMFDPELRHLFATNPELLENGCQSSGAPRLQCDLFRSLLQIVDTAATKPNSPRNQPVATHTMSKTQRAKMTSTGYPDFDTTENKQKSRTSNDYSDYYDTKAVKTVSGNRNVLPNSNGGTPGSTYQPKDCDAILLRKYNRRGMLRRRIRN